MIAKIILQQIGGSRFTVMTGSSNYISLENGLRMNLARNKTSANRLEIKHEQGTDTYQMRFYRMSVSKHFNIKITDIAIIEAVEYDKLEENFTSVTGLVTRI